MKPSELRSMTMDELHGELSEQERGYYNLRFRRSVGEDIQPAQMKRARREIARIKTIITEKENVGAAPAGRSAARTS
jgi:large subunit ribosomal protein L29